MYGYLHALSFTSNTLKSFITILFNFETEKAKYCFISWLFQIIMHLHIKLIPISVNSSIKNGWIHMLLMYIFNKKSPYQHPETWTPASTYTLCYYKSVYTCISITDKFHTIIKKKSVCGCNHCFWHCLVNSWLNILEPEISKIIHW